MTDRHSLTHRVFPSHPFNPPKFRFRKWPRRLGIGLVVAPLALGAIASLPPTPRAIAAGQATEPGTDGNSGPTSHTPTSQHLAQAPILHVDPARGIDSAGSTGSEAGPFRSITYALQKATPGTVIQLAPGTYSQETGEAFPITLKSGVTLRGDAATHGQTVAIIGGGNYVSPTFARQNVGIRTLGDSQIVGVTLTNPNTRGTALWVEDSNPTVTNSTFVNSKRDGIFISAEGNPQILDNLFSQNEGNGISVARTGRGMIRGNLFQNTGFGISVNDEASPEILENRIVENRDGVVVSHSAQPILRNNLIENNSRDGLVAIAQAQPDLGTADDPGGNAIRNNDRYDLYNATRGYTISAIGNEIDESRISGAVEFVAAAVVPPDVSIELGAISDLRGHWAQSYIEALVAQGIMSGFEDGSFRPDEPVTRVQFAAIVRNAFSPAPQQPPGEFTDVSGDFWGYEAIQTAYRAGFLSGYPDGQFRPNEPITRIQGIVGLAQGLSYRSENADVVSIYQDATDIPNWALSAVAGATVQNLVVNHPNPKQLNPNRIATRAEVAAFVYQALVQAGRVQAIESPYLLNWGVGSN
ncbi:MAG: DUF1565 domain-containing protein [Limnospira sp.]